MQKKAIQSPGIAEAPAAAGRDCSRAPAAASRGQALIIVLCFIVLCTVLVIAFLGNVTTAGVSEKAAASENNASQLAETAVSYVEGTITNATAPGEYPTVAWACQPGMIRTYGGAAAGGSTPSPTTNLAPSAAPLAYYKLYSSNNMIVTGAAQSTALNNPASIFSNDVPSNWDANASLVGPAFFTDLNAPLYVPTTSGTATVFPIVDPRAADSDIAVGGFSYTTGTNTTLSGTIDGIYTSGTTGTYATDTTSRLPMPVRWMYVLSNGSLTVPTSGTGSSASWQGSTNSPTASNPIVGRVAFWTDDECSKVNINTASEGTYWDTPVANSGATTDLFTSGTVALGDTVLANIDPVQHEYQRYPGHPAMTCLSAVFGTILNNYGNAQGDRSQMVKSITDTIPRISDYGSDPNTNAAVVGSTPPTGSATTTLGGTVQGSGTSVIVDEDRLYASLDEYQFSPNYSGNTGASGTGTRVAQTFLSNASQSGSNEALNYVDTCRFFLTAHSKGPELNMFGLPRVAMWPLWDTHQQPFLSTSYEKEILRCSTVNTSGTDNNPHIMAFFRYDPTSATNDFTVGTTGTGSNVNRNAVVYAYLQQLLRTKVPGYGFSFYNKYISVTNGVNDCDQILTEIFDYIRCTNLADNSVGATPYTSGGTGANTSSNVNQAGAGQVVPIQIPSTSGSNAQGLGRIATIGELALVLIKVDDRANTSVAESSTNLTGTVQVNGYPGVTTVNPQTQTLLEWGLVPRMVCPMEGYAALANNLRISFTGLNLKIGGVAVSGSVSDIYDTGRYASDGRDSVMGGTIGPASLIEPGSPPASLYPTGLVVINGTNTGTTPAGTPITISGSVTAVLSAPGVLPSLGTVGASGSAVQTYNFSFPSMTVPIPALYGTSPWSGTLRTPGSAYVGSATTGTFNYPTLPLTAAAKSNITRYQQGYKFPFGSSSDVCRTLSPLGPIVSSGTAYIEGDERLVAITPVVSSTTFSITLTGSGTVPGLGDFMPGSMRCGNGIIPIGSNTHGTLISGTAGPSNYGSDGAPEAPPMLGSANQSVTPFVSNPGGLGDWDNGQGQMGDGPWANKPDEGTTPGGLPYFGGYEAVSSPAGSSITYFSPNRQISSPVMFGSLPVGPDHPWRTLLFRPAVLPGHQTESSANPHPGNPNEATTLPDDLLLDLFWMPVVEPYGISEPLATSGKINLNYQIAPFTYITRKTGMEAVLKSVMITALNPAPNGIHFIGNYKIYQSGGAAAGTNPTVTTRYPIDPNLTLAQFDARFAQTLNPSPTYSAATRNFFVSATEICDIPLIPLNYPGVTGTSTLSAFWSANTLTGENSLERPYSLIYPRVTTKSNIFTVHVIAQSLKQSPADLQNGTWTENLDQVTSEYHGAFTIEKYLDPDSADMSYYKSGGYQLWPNTNDGLIDGSTATTQTVAIRNAKWRLLGVKRFGQ